MRLTLILGSPAAPSQPLQSPDAAVSHVLAALGTQAAGGAGRPVCKASARCHSRGRPSASGARPSALFVCADPWAPSRCTRAGVRTHHAAGPGPCTRRLGPRQFPHTRPAGLLWREGRSDTSEPTPPRRPRGAGGSGGGRAPVCEPTHARGRKPALARALAKCAQAVSPAHSHYV